jgi:uncharacterized repeat protein (TIGR03806 family)
LFALVLVAACSGPAGPREDVILAEKPAEKLSAYGFFTDAGGRKPADGVVAFDLVNPLFSDHAGKHRFVHVPKGKTAAYSANDVFDFPVGTVLIKTFTFPQKAGDAWVEKYVETRLLIHKAEGWTAYPYIWNAEETEAILAPVGKRMRIDTQDESGEALSIDYAVPNRNQCKQCHSKGDTLLPIGPTARNLNHAGPGGANQLTDWAERGMLTGFAGDAPAAPAAFDENAGSLEDRARAWLDINCAHCHRARGGASNSALFLAWDETDRSGWGVRKRPVAAGRGSGDALFVIEPGKPEESILYHRIASVEPGVLMPELGRTVVDERGLKLIGDWIAAMPPVSP